MGLIDLEEIEPRRGIRRDGQKNLGLQQGKSDDGQEKQKSVQQGQSHDGQANLIQFQQNEGHDGLILLIIIAV